MASTQQFCLRWNNHQSTLISVFDHLLESGTLVDCTLAAEGQFLKAHKVVLSACSPYLEALLSQHYEKHPILILKDVTFLELKAMLDYMYRGEVNISQEQLGNFLKAAESLQIKGLTDNGVLSENRELDRSRDIEQARELNRLERSTPAFSKKTDGTRKQPLLLPRPRSPLVGLPPNFMINADYRKSNKHQLPQEVNSGSPSVKNREGSLSPTIKRKRQCPPPLAQPEETNVQIPIENNHEANNHNESQPEESPQLLQTLSNSVPSSVESSKKHADSGKPVESDVIKREVKSESVEFLDEVHNDDSVEDLTLGLADEEEEEMDEMDLSRPGPSNVSNSHVAGIPWHISGEGNGEDLLLASQQDSQGLPGQDVSPDNKFRCPRCGKGYVHKPSLRNHYLFECHGMPQLHCQFCSFQTFRKGNLTRHLAVRHQVLPS